MRVNEFPFSVEVASGETFTVATEETVDMAALPMHEFPGIEVERTVGMLVPSVYGAYLTVSDSLLGIRRQEETPEEQAEREAKHARYDAARAVYEAAVDAVDEPHWRAVLDLHARDRDTSYPLCQGCDFGGYEGDAPEWPCRTVELVAEQCGITVPRWGDA